MAERITDWDQLYPGRFFKAGEIKENERLVLTISAIALEELEGDKGLKTKGVLSFHETKMQLALNKTNGICIKAMFGRVPYEWIGKRIALFRSEWKGDDCIRVWGSPDIERDIDVEVHLPRKKPFPMVMHSMRRPAAVPPPSEPAERIGEAAGKLLRALADAGSLDDVDGVAADVAMGTFTEWEARVLAKAVDKRRKQLGGGAGVANG